MSLVSVYIHMVFATKKRKPFLYSRELRYKICEHMRNNARDKKIWLDSINGHRDHLHCLISLGKTQTISDVARYLKGESSFWINKNRMTVKKFSWQDDFWTVGVSESHVADVRKYIHNQEEKHRVVPFAEEIEKFMKKYGMKIIKKQGG